MIDIKRGRAVDEIAHEWLDKVKTYLDTPGQYYWTDDDKKRHYVDSYAVKLEQECIYAVNNSTASAVKKRLWLRLIRHFKNNIEDLILASPKEMAGIVNSGRYADLFQLISKCWVWHYENLPKEYGYFIVNKLNLKTCPYCNRLFIRSYKGIRQERPELDHFHPKADYPIFCLSFYNLIPACHSCNHVKLEDPIRVNPYDRAFKRKFIITDKNGKLVSKSKIYKLTEKEIQIAFDGRNTDEEENDRVLGLTNVYNEHKDYVKELIDKSMAYDAHACKALVESFQGVGHHPRQVYDFVWGKHLFAAEHEDRPLSKLTKDMLDLLDIKR